MHTHRTPMRSSATACAHPPQRVPGPQHASGTVPRGLVTSRRRQIRSLGVVNGAVLHAKAPIRRLASVELFRGRKERSIARRVPTDQRFLSLCRSAGVLGRNGRRRPGPNKHTCKHAAAGTISSAPESASREMAELSRLSLWRRASRQRVPAEGAQRSSRALILRSSQRTRLHLCRHFCRF